MTNFSLFYINTHKNVIISTRVEYLNKVASTLYTKQPANEKVKNASEIFTVNNILYRYPEMHLTWYEAFNIFES